MALPFKEKKIRNSLIYKSPSNILRKWQPLEATRNLYLCWEDTYLHWVKVRAAFGEDWKTGTSWEEARTSFRANMSDCNEKISWLPLQPPPGNAMRVSYCFFFCSVVFRKLLYYGSCGFCVNTHVEMCVWDGTNVCFRASWPVCLHFFKTVVPDVRL